MYLLLLEEPCVAYYHSRYREVPLVLVAVLEVSVCSTQWDKGLYETTPSTMHRGWKGIFNSFSKKVFSKSAYKDKNSQRTQILCMNDYIW